MSVIDSADLLCALAVLTENQREAFIDHAVLHRTDAEIADTMGVSKGRVFQLRTRAAERLIEQPLYRAAA